MSSMALVCGNLEGPVIAGTERRSFCLQSLQGDPISWYRLLIGRTLGPGDQVLQSPRG